MIKKLTRSIATLFAAASLLSCKSRAITEEATDGKKLQAVQFRTARPTNNLEQVKIFYTEALGLEVLGSFEGHAGYDGIMLAMPDKTHHLEFTQYEHYTELPKPTKEHLMVFYYSDTEAYKTANERIKKMGILPVEPENPYWKDKSKTYEDPDGWRVILFNGVYKP